MRQREFGRESEGPSACPGCGTLLEDMTNLRQELADVREDLKEAHRQLGIAHMMVTKLRSEQRREQPDPRTDEALEILRYWKALCAPRTRELNGPRLKNCLARLNGHKDQDDGYSAEELKECVRGYAFRPYVVNGCRVAQGTPDQRYVDAELVFRDAKHVDQGIMLARLLPPGENVSPAAPPPRMSPGSDAAQFMALFDA
jgi:hypothetical protein